VGETDQAIALFVSAEAPFGVFDVIVQWSRMTEGGRTAVDERV
jgi:hypothetical protein